jgi:hypothetical protein
VRVERAALCDWQSHMGSGRGALGIDGLLIRARAWAGAVLVIVRLCAAASTAADASTVEAPLAGTTRRTTARHRAHRWVGMTSPAMQVLARESDRKSPYQHAVMRCDAM